MNKEKNILIDQFDRLHSYLRISITERCNLRCTYCMPEEGVSLSPKSNLMSADEIFTIAKEFVDNGVTKIRITGGEPLVRKDVRVILEQLSTLPINLSITTNAVIVDQFIPFFKEIGLNNINVSLDSLKEGKSNKITRRDYFTKVKANILLLIENGLNIKLNAVLIKDFNDDEIIDFIEFTKSNKVSVRFIEFMPFDGNKWNLEKIVSLQAIKDQVFNHYPTDDVIRLNDERNDTAKNYKIKNYKGSFAVISSVTNPFCDSCNRLRLTANGQLKNCLFSSGESDLLTSLRNGEPIAPVIKMAVLQKKKIRSGMESIKDFENPKFHEGNRSMTTIGG
tara:strand:- start:1292 stop:2299 length:1008 start_codon:yes stop_codon:yes gene_type:complete